MKKYKKIGIYAITNLTNNKKYIGQSIDLNNRLHQHRYSLKRNNHSNQHLQASFNQYGFNNFKFDILEYCTLDQLSEREQYWINQFDRKNMYNIVLDVINCAFTNKNYSIKKESKKMNDEEKKCMSIKIATKLTEKMVLEIKDLLIKNELTNQEIAKLYNISNSYVSSIAYGKSWSTVTGGPVIKRVIKRRSRKHSKSTLEKIRLGNVGKKLSHEHKNKLSLAKLGKKMSQETKDKIRVAITGKKRSQEFKDKVSKTKREMNKELKGN